MSFFRKLKKSSNFRIGGKICFFPVYVTADNFGGNPRNNNMFFNKCDNFVNN